MINWNEFNMVAVVFYTFLIGGIFLHGLGVI